MNKHLRITVYIVMAAAIAMIALCSMNYINLGKKLHSFEEQLAQSRMAWETTAAEKEKLQDELKAKQKKLNIAQLELDNSNREAETIRAEIEQLKAEIEALKQDR